MHRYRYIDVKYLFPNISMTNEIIKTRSQNPYLHKYDFRAHVSSINTILRIGKRDFHV